MYIRVQKRTIQFTGYRGIIFNEEKMDKQLNLKKIALIGRTFEEYYLIFYFYMRNIWIMISIKVRFRSFSELHQKKSVIYKKVNYEFMKNGNEMMVIKKYI